MNRRLAYLIAALAGLALLGAVGANPRYLEELRIGGGFGDTADGGADLEKNGDLRTNGRITADGGLATKGRVTKGGMYQGLSTEGLIGLWRCEGLPTFPDWSGEGYTMTVGGSGTASVPGKYGSGLQFTGAGYATASTTIPSTRGAQDLTISAWFQTTWTGGNGNLSGWYGGSSGELCLLYLVAGKPAFGVRDTGAVHEVTAITGTSFADGKWHHAVGVRDFGTSIQLFVDGELLDSRPDTVNNASDAVNLFLGSATTTFIPYTGLLDEVSIWSRALSESEVKALYGLDTELADAFGGQGVNGNLNVSGDVAVNGGDITSASGDVSVTPGGAMTRLVKSAGVLDAAALGSELVVNGTMDGTYVGGVAPNWSVAGGSATPSEVQGASAYGGSGSSQRVTVSSMAANGFLQSGSFSLAQGKWYRLRFAAKVESGKLEQVRILQSGVQTIAQNLNDPAWQSYTFDFCAPETAGGGVQFFNQFYTPGQFVVDAVSVKEITAGDLNVAGGMYSRKQRVYGEVTADGNVVTAGDIAANGGDFTSTATQFNLLGGGVATLNVGATATSVTVGAQSGSMTIRNPSVFLNPGGTQASLVRHQGGRLGFYHEPPSGAVALIDLNPSPTDGSSDALLRVFRETNTTGSKRLEIMAGNNTATANFRFTASTSAPVFSVLNGGGTANQITMAGATGDITTVGDLVVNGGDITSTGNLTISPGGGTLSVPALLSGTQVNGTLNLNPAANDPNNYAGVSGSGSLGSSATADSTGSMSGVMAILSIPYAGRTITTGHGLWAQLACWDSNRTGTINTAYIIRAYNNNTAYGRVDNLYGVYIDGVQRGAVSNYALYTNAGAVSFGDDVAIRGTKGLSVGGDVAVNGGDITSTASTLALSPAAGGSVTVNGDLNAATGKSIKGAFKASSGAAGVSGAIVIPKLTTGGSNGSITVADGIITAFTNPT